MLGAIAPGCFELTLAKCLELTLQRASGARDLVAAARGHAMEHDLTESNQEVGGKVGTENSEVEA